MSTLATAVIDVSNLAHRLYHTISMSGIGGSRADSATKPVEHPLVYLFLRSLVSLRQTLNCDDFIFCFDDTYTQPSPRSLLFPGYKGGQGASAEQLSIRKQINKVEEVLQELGFGSLYKQPAWEADDLMALLAKSAVQSNARVVLVSNDADLLQLLSTDTVTIWHPCKKKILTAFTFLAEYGIEPEEWHVVKAMCGDVSDHIPGVVGVGLATALKFIRKELPEHYKTYQSLKDNWTSIVEHNMRLTKLPCPMLGGLHLEMKADHCTPEIWDAVCGRFNPSLIRRYPW